MNFPGGSAVCLDPDVVASRPDWEDALWKQSPATAWIDMSLGASRIWNSIGNCLEANEDIFVIAAAATYRLECRKRRSRYRRGLIQHMALASSLPVRHRSACAH